MLSVETVLDQILNSTHPLESYGVPVPRSYRRVASESVLSPISIPLFDNSSMDGYAVLSSDVRSASATNPVTLRLIDSVPAGSASCQTVSTGTAIRIFTGSPLPRGADAVVMQEDVRVPFDSRDTIIISEPIRPFENVRLKGEDLKQGTLLLAKGQEVGFGQLALLSAVGLKEVRVQAQPLVGLISTGSELREAGQTLGPGEIYESNRATLACMLERDGLGVRPFPLVCDSRQATQDILTEAFETCDAVITTGGVSVGEHDHVKDAFVAIGGKIDLWRIAARPGKPFLFGLRKSVPLFGLPGNPVSAMVGFQILVRPALARMRGLQNWVPKTLQANLSEAIPNPGDRRHFVRVKMLPDGTIASSGRQASHMLSSLATSIGLVDVPPSTTLEAGQTVCVILWD